MPVDYGQVSRRWNRSQVAFLLCELAAGNTFVRIARTKGNRDDAARNRALARKAYDSVLHFMGRVSMSHEEAQKVHVELAALKRRLIALGEPL